MSRLNSIFDQWLNSLFDQLVNDLGINRIRLEINSGIENPTDYYAQWRNGQITEQVFNSKRYEIINDKYGSEIAENVTKFIEKEITNLEKKLKN